jgi:beta-glucosidase
VLFGRVNPGGKLPVTIARNVGQLPVFYNRKPTARRGYLFDSNQPLYPFGFGLSYTTFDISAPRIANATVGTGDNVRVEVDVANNRPACRRRGGPALRPRRLPPRSQGRCSNLSASSG